MGLVVLLQDEEGAAVAAPVVDEAQLLDAILPDERQSYPYLTFIDPYGDTIYNRPQMIPFLEEWRRLGASVRNPEAARLMRQIEELAELCEREVHTFLVFRGD